MYINMMKCMLYMQVLHTFCTCVCVCVCEREREREREREFICMQSLLQESCLCCVPQIGGCHDPIVLM